MPESAQRARVADLDVRGIGMIYLACPYSHPDPRVREYRFEAANWAAAKLMSEGHHVFSPISHSHPIAQYGLPKNWDFWRDYDELFVKLCTRVVVLKLDGWRKSVGVMAEIALADEIGKPWEFMDAPPDRPDLKSTHPAACCRAFGRGQLY